MGCAAAIRRMSCTVGKVESLLATAEPGGVSDARAVREDQKVLVIVTRRVRHSADIATEHNTKRKEGEGKKERTG